jgi:hypothetical protein
MHTSSHLPSSFMTSVLFEKTCVTFIKPATRAAASQRWARPGARASTPHRARTNILAHLHRH